MLAAHAATGNANIWLKGPYGPPFFDIVLSAAAYFTVLGVSLGPGGSRSRARRGVAAGGAAFLGIALPLALGTRLFSWGEGAEDAPTAAWVYLVLGAYAAGTALALAALGVSARPDGRRRGAGLALAAGAAAYGLDRLVQPWLAARTAALPFTASLWLPPPVMLASGVLWGLLVGAALGRGEDQ